MRNLLHTLTAVAAFGIGTLTAQTNPTPWNFNTQGNYSFTSLAPGNPATMPASMARKSWN